MRTHGERSSLAAAASRERLAGDLRSAPRGRVGSGATLMAVGIIHEEKGDRLWNRLGGAWNGAVTRATEGLAALTGGGMSGSGSAARARARVA